MSAEQQFISRRKFFNNKHTHPVHREHKFHQLVAVRCLDARKPNIGKVSGTRSRFHVKSTSFACFVLVQSIFANYLFCIESSICIPRCVLAELVICIHCLGLQIHRFILANEKICIFARHLRTHTHFFRTIRVFPSLKAQRRGRLLSTIYAAKTTQ